VHSFKPTQPETEGGWGYPCRCWVGHDNSCLLGDFWQTRESRNSPEILHLIVLVPDTDGVTGIDQCDVDRAVVFTLKQKLCPILRNLADRGPLVKWRTITFGDPFG
jgi:hypothetical protein